MSAKGRKRFEQKITSNVAKHFQIAVAIFAGKMPALPAIEDFTQHLV